MWNCRALPVDCDSFCHVKRTRGGGGGVDDDVDVDVDVDGCVGNESVASSIDVDAGVDVVGADVVGVDGVEVVCLRWMLVMGGSVGDDRDTAGGVPVADPRPDALRQTRTPSWPFRVEQQPKHH